jgi:K+-sensing histidine kinase KdpD
MSTRDPSWRRVRTFLRYGVAVASVLVALLLTRVLAWYFESFRTPLFFSAIMLSTWFGGFIPGMVATLLSVLALKYYYMPPLYSWFFDLRHVPLFVIFSSSALFISWVIAKQQHAERAVRRVLDVMEAAVRERTATLRRTNEELQAEVAEGTRTEEALRASEERWRAVSSTPFSPPSREAWAWGCRSAARSSRRMAAGWGPQLVATTEQPFSSPCPWGVSVYHE